EKDYASKRVRRSQTSDPKQSRTLLLSFNHLSISGREGNRDADLATFRGWENHDKKSFDVAIDGLRRNSKLLEHTWTNYYELCRSQNAFLHENLLKRHHKLVVGIIAETLVIANGMNVGFLHAKLNRLQSLVSISEEELYLKRREEAKVEHAHMEEEIKRLELEILELKEASKMLDAEKLHIPFCKAYLSKQDVTIILIEEDKKEFTVKLGYEGQTIHLELIRVLAYEFQKGQIKNYCLVSSPFCVSIDIQKKWQFKVSRGVIFWGNLDIESFDVAVNGLRMNSELSKDMGTKYYELCRSQNVFLHEKFLKQNIKVFDRIIIETVIIADGMKGSNLSTFMNNFVAWDQSLEGFEHLGMNVGFIRTKLRRLMNLVSKSE
ncbi:hypothetical protein GIB67_016705, partial [Kingdonia uniflora]